MSVIFLGLFSTLLSQTGSLTLQLTDYPRPTCQQPAVVLLGVCTLELGFQVPVTTLTMDAESELQAACLGSQLFTT